MKVSIQYAETHFADLAAAASLGEEVQIELPGKPALKLVATAALVLDVAPPRRSRRELGGAWEGLVPSISQEEWDAVHREFLASLPDAFDMPDNAKVDESA